MVENRVTVVGAHYLGCTMKHQGILYFGKKLVHLNRLQRCTMLQYDEYSLLNPVQHITSLLLPPDSRTFYSSRQWVDETPVYLR